jgi:hypothetical protein
MFCESSDDVVFYFEMIRAIAGRGRELKYYICDGKKGVLIAAEFAHKTGKLLNSLFLVDKDHDDLLGGPAIPAHVFVTDYYSVENYLCTRDAFAVVWREQIGLPENKLFDRCSRQIERALKTFSTKMRPLMAWAIEERKRGGEVVFGNVPDTLKPFFDISGMTVKPKPKHLSSFIAKCASSPTPCRRKDWTATDNLLRGLPPKTWLRGKFELTAFLLFANEVWANLVGTSISPKKKVKQPHKLAPSNIFGFVAAKLAVPAALEAYIRASISPLP